MKRIILFLATNLAVIAVLSIVLRVTGLDRWLEVHGGSYSGLLVFAAVFGFGGALISLAISKWSAKRAMGVQVIDKPANANEEWLVGTVRQLATQAGIGKPSSRARKTRAAARFPPADPPNRAICSGLRWRSRAR